MRGLRRLTFTRFIAAMLVVIFHFGKDVWPFSTNALSFLVHQGPSAVSYFYSLSGFVMAVAYPAIQNRPVDRQAFWVARFARIYPAFVLAMLFAIALSTNTPQLQIWLPLLGLQAWSQSHLNYLNPPAWSISVELVFYLLFPLLISAFCEKRIRSTRRLIILFWGGSQVVFSLIAAIAPMNQNFFRDFLFYNPVLHLNEFLLGVLIGSAYVQARLSGFWYSSPLKPLAVIVCLYALAILIGRERWPMWIQYTNGLLAPLFLWFIVALATAPVEYATWMTSKLAILLGESSYAIYIFQYPMRIAFTKYVEPMQALSSTAITYLYLAALILLSVLVHVAVEKPARLWLRKKMAANNPAVNSAQAERT